MGLGVYSPLKQREHGFGYIVIRSPYISYSIYLRGTITIIRSPSIPYFLPLKENYMGLGLGFQQQPLRSRSKRCARKAHAKHCFCYLMKVSRMESERASRLEPVSISPVRNSLMNQDSKEEGPAGF